MKKIHLVLLMIAFVATAKAQDAKPYYYDASISPNSSEIVFVSGGDIWSVAASGGEARLLISNPANETRPLYSPDGKSIAFNSSRSGNGDVYVWNIATGTLTRLTYDDANDEVNGWSADGKYLYFTSTGKDIGSMRDVYRVSINGGTPMLVSDNRYVAEYYAAPSPVGKTLALVGKGYGAIQWWRNGRSHIDESEIWLMDEASKKYTQLAASGAKQLWPMWTPDGKTLYYVSDRSGKQNIWVHPLNGTAKQVTGFKDGRVLFPSISKDGKTIVFERNFAVWKMDVATGESKPVDITLKGSSASTASDFLRVTSGFSDLAISPDGKKLAVIAQGEVFVAGVKDGGDATRVTATIGLESNTVWSKNSNVLYYVGDRDNKANIYQYDFLTAKETQLTTANADDGSLTLSPDGKKLAFVRNAKELRVLELATKKELLLVTAPLSFVPTESSGNFSWSPDNKWIAFASYANKAFRNIYIVPATGGEAKPVSFLANTFGSDVVWGNQGKSVLFVTVQRTENGQVARVDLQPRLPRFREDQFRDLFSDQSTSVKTTKTDAVIDSLAPVTNNNKPIVFEGIKNRLSLLPLTGADVQGIIISKDGNTLIAIADIAGQTNIYSYSLDEMAKEPAVLKQLTFTAGNKNSVQLSDDGKDIYYIESGRVQTVSIDGKQTKSIALTAELNTDFNARKMEVFRQAWEMQQKGFYDEHYHGADWNAIQKQYEPYAAGAQTMDEERRILSLMVGELNASHSGVSSNTPATFNVGHLGLRFEKDAYENEGKLKITEVVASGPAALTGKIHVGDVLFAVDGNKITANTNLDQLLLNKVNRRVMLTIIPANADSRSEEIAIKPVELNTEKGLLYNQWVQQNRDYVARMSNGRLGYVHMIDMGQGSLDKLYLDLDAQAHANDGVVVDIRNNNGGFVNAYAIDVLARRGYMSMQARGLPAAPARIQLGQRSLEAPTILITNRHSLSDAEDFSEGYRTLGLGKIVGEPTAGWIIYTSNYTLFDGTIVRLPFIKIMDHEGKDMELNPRPVDVQVNNGLGDNKDEQLNTAVQELLKQVDKK
jgi:tricorn protease